MCLWQALHTDLCLLDDWHSEQGGQAWQGSCELWMHRGALAERRLIIDHTGNFRELGIPGESSPEKTYGAWMGWAGAAVLSDNDRMECAHFFAPHLAKVSQ